MDYSAALLLTETPSTTLQSSSSMSSGFFSTPHGQSCHSDCHFPRDDN